MNDDGHDGDLLEGYEGDTCDECWHAYCYHSDNDPEDGTVRGCQVTGCKCKKYWRDNPPNYGTEQEGDE